MKNNNNNLKVMTKSIRLFPLALVLSSCAATQTAIEHRNLEISTKLSQTIFLDPVLDSQKTIFVSLKNTSEETISIEQPLKEALKAKGYRVVAPAEAHYWLQANILKVGKMSTSASERALGGGFGSSLAGAGTGAALGALTSSSRATLVSGIAGGLVGLVADSVVKDVNYVVITDVRISERSAKGVKIQETFRSALANGSSSGSTQYSTNQSQYKHYSTRIVSRANQVNLSFVKARPALEQGLVKTLAGNF